MQTGSTVTMDTPSSQPGTPATVLQEAAHDRLNQQRDRDMLFSSTLSDAAARASPVLDKISQFNTLALQQSSGKLDRKTADAALKRAMLGREEAESEMRRYRDDARSLRKLVEEGRERERRVGERLETVMENYGRAKETFAHTQALWEKEIRRARKETFKSQSGTVKLQEELKAARSSLKMAEENVEREKERSRVREQEAFSARYQLVGVQEQLDQALERIKLVEQERDAFKMLAREEEVARIAAEGRIPLPVEEDSDDEFASPKKKARVSVSAVDIVSSVAAEEELEELSRQVQWERRRADRALEEVEFLQTECQLRCCPCARASTSNTHLRASAPASPKRPKMVSPAKCVDVSQSTGPLEMKKAPRRSTIFIPSEGIFRTVSQEEAEAHIAAIAEEVARDADADAEVAATSTASTEPLTPAEIAAHESEFARTPSVEPPTFAMLRQQRTSLLSLLDAPHGDGPTPTMSIPTIPTVSCDVAAATVAVEATEEEPLEPVVLPEDTTSTDSELDVTQSTVIVTAAAVAITTPVILQPASESHLPPPPEPEAGSAEEEAESPEEEEEGPEENINSPPRPHTSAAFYTVTTTTTVPVRDIKTPLVPGRQQRQRPLPPRPASAGDNVNNGTRAAVAAVTPSRSFDSAENPLVTPTVTREQALAQIRERRGRVRSADQQQSHYAQATTSSRGQGQATQQQARSLTVTPRRPAVGGAHRDVSAPATVGGKARVPSGGGGSGSARGR